MNTKQLRYLITIAQFGNLSRAAAHLGISQPALSKLLRGWEDSYGFSFFLSFQRQLTPTAVGRYYLDCAQRILDEQNRMLLTMRTLGGDSGQSIRLCTAPNRAAIIYSQIFQHFSRTFPDIELGLVEKYAKDQPSSILRGKADLAIGAGPISEDVEDIPFAREELLVALPASHPLSSRKSIQLRELRDTPFVLQGSRNSIRSIADGLFAEAGFEPVIVFQSDDVLLIDAMLHQNVGAGFVSRVHVEPCEEIRYLTLDPPVFQIMHIRYPKGHTLTEAQKYLAGLLIRHRLKDPRYEPISSPEVEELLNAEKTIAAAALPEAGLPSSGSAGEIGDAGNEISLDTTVLKYLIAIVDEGSLSKAAERHLLAQPAMSRHLRNTEQMLGMQLFSRKHNCLYPTNVGKIFVNSARNILLAEKEMNAYIQKYRAGHGGKIFVHCDSILTEYFQNRAYVPFSNAYPDMKITLLEAEAGIIKEALQNASSDIGLFLTRNPKHNMLKYEILGCTELVYCRDLSDPLPPDKALDSDEIFTLDSISEKRHMMLASPGTTLRKEQERLIDDLFREPPEISAEASFPILRKLAALGGGDTILPLHFLQENVAQHALHLRQPNQYYLILASNPSRTLPPSVLGLMNLIRTNFQGLLPLPATPSS